ncbi:MBL fold metallo-hydrolase [Novosphingobium flavum]|uniref:MBL fold metallo-hydrolase n=1 Tax=Novosphingobium flavum TaxID=1778672 RepID=A0A7X1FSE5_9SPHN|nr:MBL fold metallo-hydrolase [Novosphingobium flavum]MBC2666123.1 MBL fold metallo-hydrolase [Novosphingobium flavum]
MLVAVGLAALGTAASAQRPAAPPVPPPPADLQARSVVPGLWVIDETPAHGGSITILAGPEGLLLVDTGVESWAPAVAATVSRLGPGPVRYVINTHAHVDEIAGNGFFAGKGATIVGQDGVREFMLTPRAPPAGADGRTARQARAFPREAAPTITFDREMGLTFGGQELRLIAVPRAHTASDILIRFPALDVIVVGDVLRAGEFPSINRADGGTLDGMLAGLDRILALAGPNTWLITSHGQVVHRDAAEAQRRLLITARDHAAAMIGQGKSLDEVQAADITQGLGAEALPGHVSAQQFVRDLYNELKARG